MTFAMRFNLSYILNLIFLSTPERSCGGRPGGADPGRAKLRGERVSDALRSSVAHLGLRRRLRGVPANFLRVIYK